MNVKEIGLLINSIILSLLKLVFELKMQGDMQFDIYFSILFAFMTHYNDLFMQCLISFFGVHLRNPGYRLLLQSNKHKADESLDSNGHLA